MTVCTGAPSSAVIALQYKIINMKKFNLLWSVIAIANISPALSQQAGTVKQVRSQLIPVCQSEIPWNGVTTSDNGRIFTSFPHLEGDAGIRIGEIKKDRKIVPYPDLSWNNWKAGDQTARKIVRPNALRIGPDGNLWIVDTGAPQIGSNALPGAAKLIVVNLHTNRVIRTIPLAGVMKEKSFIDDLRIYGSTIYLTDAAEPALIIMDKISGKGRRVLENDPSTTDTAPLLAEGQVMKTGDGQEVHIHADQLEISPDGKYFYFQPVSGPLSRIETKYLKNPALTDRQLAAHIMKWYKTPTTGGTAIDAAGNIYLSDVDHSQIIRIDTKGTSEVIVKDNRLIWSDALWIDKNGYLWIPSGQLNRLAVFQKGTSTIKLPVHIYKIKINAKPFKS